MKRMTWNEIQSCFPNQCVGLIDVETGINDISIYYKREHEIAEKLTSGKITKEQFEIEHQKSFTELAGLLVDAGVILKEVLWNGKPQKHRDVATNHE